jgi:hypothetical protein
MGLAEDLIHDLSSPGEGGDDLVPVDEFGRRGLVVPGQQRSPQWTRRARTTPTRTCASAL